MEDFPGLPFSYALKEFPDLLKGFIKSAQMEPLQSYLCQIALNEFFESVSSVSFHPWFHLPLLPLTIAPHVNEDQFKQLVVAIALIYMGLALDDHVADNELRLQYWKDTPRHTVQYTATNLSGNLATLAINQLNIDPNCKLQLHKIKTKYHMDILTGQQADLKIMNSNPWNVDDIINCFMFKTGKIFAMGAVLAGTLVNHSSVLISNIEQICLLIGIMAQIRDDYRDLFVNEVCTDLKNGLYTFPIVQYANSLPLNEKENFVSLLKKAKDSDAALNEINQILKSPEVLQACLLAIALFKNELMKILDRLSLSLPAYQVWKKIIDEGSWGIHNPMHKSANCA